MVLNKPNSQSKEFPSGEAEKKMGGEIGIRGNKGSSLIPMDLLKIPLWNNFPFGNSQPSTAGAASPTNTAAPSSQGTWGIFIPVVSWSWMVSLLGPLGLDFLFGRSWMGLFYWNSSTGTSLLATCRAGE